MITNLNNQHAIGINGVNGKSPLILNTSGEHSDWGETYINKDGVINIVSFSKQRKHYYIFYDDMKNYFLLVHKITGKEIVFECNQHGLYERVNNFTASAIQQYTLLQRKRAEHARSLHNK